MSSNVQIDIASDTITGVEAIAAFIGKSPRQTNYLLEKRQLPAFKIGDRYHMRKSRYLTFLEGLEASFTKELTSSKDSQAA